MSNTEEFQATVVAGVEVPGAKEATKAFDDLLKIVDALEGEAKKTGAALIKAFNDGKTPVGELSSLVRTMARDLKFASTVNKGAELINRSEVEKAKEFNRIINELAKYQETLRQRTALAKYELGLQSKTMLEASSSMKVLEKNIKAVEGALQDRAGNTALIERKKLLEGNKVALEGVIKSIQQQTQAEQLQNQIANKNMQDANARFAEVKKLQKQRVELEGSAKEQTRISNARLDYSAEGRAFAEQQAKLRSERIAQSLQPGKEDAAIQKLRDQSRNDYLKQVYQDAGIKPLASFTATLQDGAKVKALMAEIKDIETRLVTERAKGNKSLQDEEKLLEEIRSKSIQVANARHDQSLNDPERVGARRDAQARNMLSRAGGEGGAALLAVQASLMANYSILQGVVGGMRAAITTSVELEAAFRNVQAVTGTSKTEMNGLETTIKSVAAASKFSSIEVAGAALILGQAGLSAKQVGEALQPVVMLASAAGTSIAQAVDLVTSVIGVFDKNTTDVADIANKITQAANSSKVSVEKLALGFQYAGNTAAQMGISFEETTAAMAAMSQAGIKNGSTMGTGLRQFLTETQKPSKEFIETMHRLGLSLSDIDFKSNGLVGVTKKLREAGFVASDAIKSFDVRGAAAFNALIANPEELERQYRMLLNTKAGVEANEIQMDSLKAQSARLTTSLGNLAASGFEPLSKVLAATFGGFATLTQGISEHNIMVGAAVTGLSIWIGMGAVTHFAGMAAWALKFAGAAGEASLAVTALQTASKAGSLGTLIASLSNMTLASTVASTATWSLTGAVTALKTAFMGLSIVSGIGIAIGVATAAFYAYDYVVNKTQADIDKLKASTHDSKAAFEEKDEAVKSLTKKIEDLSYREDSLKGNSEALKTESMALTSQFGAIGYQADTTNVSFESMIGKLKGIKTEMMAIRKQSLQLYIADNEKLLEKQTSKLSGELEKFNGKSGWSSNRSKQLGEIAELSIANLTGSDREKLRAAKGQLEAGNPSNMGDVAGAALIVQRIAKQLKGDPSADSKTMRKLEGVTEDLINLGRGLTDIGATSGELSRAKGEVSKTEAFDKFNTSGKFGKGKDGKPLTFEDSLPRLGNLEMIARKAGAKEDEKNPMAVFDAIKVEQERRQKDYAERLKQIKEAELSGEITGDTAATFKQIVNARVEKEKNELLEQAKATAPQATLKYGREKRLLESQLKGAKENKNKDEEIRITKALGELEISYKNRSETDQFVEKETEESIRAITEQNIKNVRDRRAGGSRDVNLRLRERTFKAEERSLDSRADELKASTKSAKSMEEVDKLLDDAVAAKIAARTAGIKALLEKQEQDKKQPGYDKTLGDIEHGQEMQAFINGKNSEIHTFAESFVSLYEAAMKRLDESTKKLEEGKRRVTEMKWEGEDRVFEAQQELREVELELAVGKKVKKDTKNKTTISSDPREAVSFGPNGVSVNLKGTGSSKTTANSGNDFSSASELSGAIRETLQQRRARAAIKAATVELEENEILLETYGNNTEGLIAEANKKYKSAQEKQKLIREQLEKTTDERTQERLTAALHDTDREVKETFRELQEFKKEFKSLRQENTGIKKKIAENTEALPQQVTLDNLLNTLDEVWSKYQDTVGDMDVMKTLRDGMTATLGSITGGLGNAFAAIATGTKSVKDAFKAMATSVIKSMIDILAQALAMQTMKSMFGVGGQGGGLMGGLMSMFGGGGGGGGGVALGGAGGAMGQAGDYGMGALLATGGLVIPKGVQRVKKMAGGGPVTGGIRGKDSVPLIGMPGEFMLNTKAVEAVGTDFLFGLNASANSVISSDMPKLPSASSSSQKDKDGGGTVNVWVVTPDQQPNSLGPKDVIAIVSDDITRGGSVKKLIRQVQTNAV